MGETKTLANCVGNGGGAGGKRRQEGERRKLSEDKNSCVRKENVQNEGQIEDFVYN